MSCALWEVGDTSLSPDSLFSVVWRLVPQFRYVQSLHCSYIWREGEREGGRKGERVGGGGEGGRGREGGRKGEREGGWRKEKLGEEGREADREREERVVGLKGGEG